jgi:hypothetical protein
MSMGAKLILPAGEPTVKRIFVPETFLKYELSTSSLKFNSGINSTATPSKISVK